jgi:hypothetical protein
MTPRVSTDPGQGRGHIHSNCTDIESGKETPVHGNESLEAAAAAPSAAAERPRACAAALTDVRANP